MAVRCPACGEVTGVSACPSCGAELLTGAGDQIRDASDRDQTASDQDQTWSDHDQTGSERDQRSADEDQHAADEDFAAGGDAVNYHRTALARERSSRDRGAVAALRDESAAARLGTAEARDQAAALRDRGAEGRDALARLHDQQDIFPDPGFFLWSRPLSRALEAFAFVSNERPASGIELSRCASVPGTAAATNEAADSALCVTVVDQKPRPLVPTSRSIRRLHA
jgi:hypothetical protein